MLSKVAYYFKFFGYSLLHYCLPIQICLAVYLWAEQSNALPKLLEFIEDVNRKFRSTIIEKIWMIFLVVSIWIVPPLMIIEVIEYFLGNPDPKIKEKYLTSSFEMTKHYTEIIVSWSRKIFWIGLLLCIAIEKIFERGYNYTRPLERVGWYFIVPLFIVAGSLNMTICFIGMFIG